MAYKVYFAQQPTASAPKLRLITEIIGKDLKKTLACGRLSIRGGARDLQEVCTSGVPAFSSWK